MGTYAAESVVAGSSTAIAPKLSRSSGFAPMSQRKSLRTTMDHEAALWSHGIARELESPLDLRREPAPDLDDPRPAMAGELEQKVDLGARRRAEEMRFGAAGRRGGQ